MTALRLPTSFRFLTELDRLYGFRPNESKATKSAEKNNGVHTLENSIWLHSSASTKVVLDQQRVNPVEPIVITLFAISFIKS